MPQFLGHYCSWIINKDYKESTYYVFIIGLGNSVIKSPWEADTVMLLRLVDPIMLLFSEQKHQIENNLLKTKA